MPSDFPRRPKLLKGALVAYEPDFLGAVPNVIVFQYNPVELRRTLGQRARQTEDRDVGQAREETQRVLGPPKENIRFTIELDAADQLDEPQTHPSLVAHGLHPALAALELLLYPAEGQIMLNRSLAQAGRARIGSETLPLVLFVWGPKRVLPVRLTNFTVTEQAFDQALNPIRAQVELGMRVLTYMELRETSLGYNAYRATQLQKETLARLNLAGSAERILGMMPF